MKNFNLKSGKLSRLLSLTAAITLLLCVGGLDSALAASAKEIDSKADAALERLYKLDGGKEFAGKAKGMLVLPNVGKGAKFSKLKDEDLDK